MNSTPDRVELSLTPDQRFRGLGPLCFRGVWQSVSRWGTRGVWGVLGTSCWGFGGNRKRPELLCVVRRHFDVIFVYEKDFKRQFEAISGAKRDVGGEFALG